ncbi:histidine--tRNA ligase [Candidatus Micrarchaeota archaeon]|nr:histidine--tRNA ligase [Candidatus Micrarchaeota archaeon]
MDLNAPRGTRDFLPEEAALRESVAGKLKEVFKKYGFVPLETPVMENIEVLSSKFAGGEEILKETYSLTDQGGRKLGLRYDLTVPLCRVFADNMMAKPFKRYQIASVFRDGPLKKGRYREFVQCDVDTLGVEGVDAEAEILSMVKEAFSSIGLDVKIKVNSRLLLNGLLEEAGVEESKQLGALLSLDKLEKIGAEGVVSEMQERGLTKKQAEKVMDVFRKAEKGFAFLEEIKNANATEGVKQLKELFALLKAYGVQAELVPNLARGLNYYTGTVFEVYLKTGEIASSLAGGGRYDDLVGQFSGKEKVPAVGISFGLDVIMEALKDHGERKNASSAKVYVFWIGDTKKDCIKVIQELRKAGIQCLLDLAGRGVSKNFAFASKQSIPFVLIVGEKELEEKKFTLRDMASGKERKLSVEDLKKELK